MCDHSETVKGGYTRAGTPRVRCNSCGSKFAQIQIDPLGRPRGSGGNYIDSERIGEMNRLFALGMSIRGVAECVGVATHTAIRYSKLWQLSLKGVNAYPEKPANPDSITPLRHDQLVEIVVTPKQDEQFYPLLLYKGGVSMGRVQALWNFARALKAMNCTSISDAVKFSATSPDANHLLGLHARLQNLAVRSWLSRLWQTPEVAELDPEMPDYLGDFAGGHPERFYFELTRVPRYAIWKTTRAWRINENTEGHRKARRPIAANVWPFITNVPARSDDFLLEVDACVPKSLPEQVRQDVCQDLIVSVLSGEISLLELQGSVKRHVQEVFKQHPMKYGPLSLDQPAPGANYKGDPREVPMKNWANELVTD